MLEYMTLPVMIPSIIILVIITLLLTLCRKYLTHPRHLHHSYLTQFLTHHWTPLDLGFTPFDTPLRTITFSGAKDNNDCHFDLKTKWSKYDVVLCNFVDRPYVQLVNPELARQFYEKESESTVRKYTVLTRQLERMVGRSVTFSEGQQWKHKRRVMTQFLNFSFIRSITTKIHAICKRQIHSFFHNNLLPTETHPTTHPIAQIHLQELIEMINSTVIAEIFFGGGNEKVDSLEIDGKTLPHFMRDLMDELFWQTIDPVSIVLGVGFVRLGLRAKDRRCNAMLKAFREFASNFVKSRLYEIEEEQKRTGTKITQPKDLIEAFYLQAGPQQLLSQSTRHHFTQNLINDFANLYTAGTDTTEHATMMMVYFIHKHPQVKQKLSQELQRNNIDAEKLTWDDVRNLTYLQAVCLETLRVYQTANGIFPREVLEEVEIGGVRLEKGTVVATQTFPVHYSDRLYENPQAFLPERWIDSDNKLKPPQPFTFNTFSHGIRSCIGKQLALQEMKMFTVYFCSKYEAEFQTLEFVMNMHGFAYEPQPIRVKFWEKQSKE